MDALPRLTFCSSHCGLEQEQALLEIQAIPPRHPVLLGASCPLVVRSGGMCGVFPQASFPPGILASGNVGMDKVRDSIFKQLAFLHRLGSGSTGQTTKCLMGLLIHG